MITLLTSKNKNMQIEDIIKDEIQFCEELDFSKNENGQYIFQSKDGRVSINLPFILEDYKQWLIENKKV
jgi:hypothetical protein